MESQDLFNPDTVHPARGTRIPGPAALTDSALCAIYIGRCYVRFSPIPSDLLRVASMLHRIHHREQAHGCATFSESRPCHCHPQCAMSVLAAIFTETGRISHDVAGVRSGMVEWRRKEPHQLIHVIHQEPFG